MLCQSAISNTDKNRTAIIRDIQYTLITRRNNGVNIGFIDNRYSKAAENVQKIFSVEGFMHVTHSLDFCVMKK